MNHRTYIIAEAGVNHNGSVDMAKELIRTAADAGADAVKFQTFRAEKVASARAPKAKYQLETTDTLESQVDMIRKLELPFDIYPDLIKESRKHGIRFLSTPFDEGSLNFLVEECHLPILKIPSGEITNAPLLLKAARTGKNVILSTGMSTLGEVELALGALSFGYLCNQEPQSIEDFITAYTKAQEVGLLQEKVHLLHCTTEYPAPFSEVNLAAMDTMKNAFHLPVGYSDHTEGISVSLAAVARGAVILEKHFTLDKTLPGPDHKASLEPHELKQLVKEIRNVEMAIGSGIKIATVSERKNMDIVRKSLVASSNIRAGEMFSKKNLEVKRPGHGVSPTRYWEYLGEIARRDYEKDEAL